MTVQSRTYSVALDASNNPLPLPLAGAAVGFVTTRWVVINNLTPYIMELSGIGDQPESQASLGPGTANKFAWSNQYGALVANWVNPITGAPPSTPQVVVEYSDDPTGAELAGSYPATLQSGVTIGSITGPVTISGTVAVSSVSGTVNVGGTVNANVTNNVTVTPSGTINVQGVAGGTAIGIAGTVAISSGTVNIGTVAGTVAIAGSVTATISGTPSVTISGTTNVAITSGSVNIGTVTGPVSVQNVAGGVILTGDLLESLASGVLPATTGTGPFTSTVALNALPHSYGALMIRITPGAGSQTWLAIAASVAGKPAFSTGCPPQPNALTPFTIIVPFANAQGDNAVVTFYSQIAGLSCSYAIFGLTTLVDIGVRGDGRAFPMGTLQLPIAAVANTTLLAGLPGMRYLLKRLVGLVSAPAAGGTSATITYTGSGAAGKTYGLAAPPAASQVATVIMETPDGVLCDPNTAVAFKFTFNAPFATDMTLDYDIVPA